MRLGGIAILLGLCVLPAHGNPPDQQVVHALTLIDSAPTKLELSPLLGNDVAALEKLTTYATPGVEFGVRLRAIRAIPHFCSNPALCRAALISVYDNINTNSEPGRPPPPGQEVLLEIAFIESLAAIRSGDPDDLVRLMSALDQPSRDVQVAAARALRDLCPNDRAVKDKLHERRPFVGPQARLAIEEALVCRRPQ
jgi:hypothetical protein